MEKMEIDRKEALKRLEEIRRSYEDASSNTHFSALITGLAGSGKTSLFKTCRIPVLIDSFDPRGVLVLRDEIARGEIYVRPWWDESSKNPTQYSAWEKQWEMDIKTGFLSLFGTYGIDSLTTLTEALANEIGKKKGRKPGMLEIQDYNPLYSTLKDIIKMSQTQNCDFIATGHLVIDKDEVVGRLFAELDTYKRMKSRIPLLFTEKFVMVSEAGSKGTEYTLLTAPKGKYRASTQIGKDGIFDIEEEPNIKALLKKAGLPYNDKPLFNKPNYQNQ